MSGLIKVKTALKPVLDPNFLPAVLWNREFAKLAERHKDSPEIAISLERNDGTVSVHRMRILPDSEENLRHNLKHLERTIKFLLWMKGGWKIGICGSRSLAEKLSAIYSDSGARRFDSELIGEKVYGRKIEIKSLDKSEFPSEREVKLRIGGNWKGCRIGFDLGGSDRKCAAVIDGEVVHTEEVAWDPYFQKDPEWHYQGINDSLKRAAAKMPRVDAIGGSSAGVIVDNQIRVASLFRGVPDPEFKSKVVNIFQRLKKDWNDVPFVVVNDGEVTALAGAMSMKTGSLLGVSMGTSQAAGYVSSNGGITNWLNELAFAPIDYRDDAPRDEWSGDIGCGVQYFSQQGVARLAELAGIHFEKSVPFAERLVHVQELMSKGSSDAEKIYSSIGICFGYAVAHYAEFYDLEKLLILGRVTSGAGGELILSKARELLKLEFPELAEKIEFTTPDEKNKRHGQAVAAASLPELK